MSDTALHVADPVDDTQVAEYIEQASRYDGSRTSPQKTALVLLMHREGKSINRISETLSMSPQTVKAIVSRGDVLLSDARQLLTANALGFAGDAIKASEEAAKRGKLADILHLTDRLGITEPPKTSAQVQVNTQVILHGGSAPPELTAPVIEAVDAEVSA